MSIAKAILSFVGLTGTGVIAGLLVVSTTNAAPQSAPDAVAVCQAALDAGASQYDAYMSVYRAEQSTAGAVATWQETREPGFRPLSALRAQVPDKPVTVCIYSGTFATPVGPPVNGVPRPPHNRLRLLVFDDGRQVLDSAGYAGAMEPEMPSDLAK